MGQTTYIKSSSRPFTTEKKAARSFQLHLDVPLMLIVVALTVVGLLMVYSTTWQYAQRLGQSSSFYVLRQMVFVGLGAGVALVLSMLDYHRFQRLIVPMIGVVLVMLIAVLFMPEDNFNATRSLFNGSVRPSEVAVLAVIIYLSFWLYSKREVLNIMSFGLVPMMVMLGVFGALIWKQPDFSAAITIFLMGGLMFYLAGAEWRQVILVVVLALVVGFFVVQFTGTGHDRWMKYMAGLNNPEDASDHMKRVFEAIARGGLFGVGIGNSITKFTGLPVPWTDSIYAVIIEETGLVGGLIILGLYVLILWRGLQIANRAPDQLGKMLAGGVTLWIVFDALLNMGVMVNLFPFAGNALPLISYGGSSMVTTMIGVGILMNISRSNIKKSSAAVEGRSYSAVIDMRRGDRRRRVSRSFGPSSTEE
jgi:cell division protein FtsW